MDPSTWMRWSGVMRGTCWTSWGSGAWRRPARWEFPIPRSSSGLRTSEGSGLGLVFRKTGAALGRQVPQVIHQLPDLRVRHQVAPRRHSGQTDAVTDDGMELPVRIMLDRV